MKFLNIKKIDIKLVILLLLFSFIVFSALKFLSKKTGSELKAYNSYKKNHRILRQGKNTVFVGEKFIVELPLISGNGYSWYEKFEPEGFIKKIEDKSFDLLNKSKKNIDEESILGGDLRFLWKFKALKEGRSKIIFRYYRYHEKETSFKKERIFDIEIIKKS